MFDQFNVLMDAISFSYSLIKLLSSNSLLFIIESLEKFSKSRVFVVNLAAEASYRSKSNLLTLYSLMGDFGTYRVNI